jgi:hypothetical protein
VGLTWQDPLTMRYPSLAVPHSLTTPPGRHAGLAWRVGAGVSRRLAGNLDLEIGYAYTHCGEMRTDAGDAVRYRPTTGEYRILLIGATRAPLRTHGLLTTLRWSW